MDKNHADNQMHTRFTVANITANAYYCFFFCVRHWCSSSYSSKRFEIQPFLHLVCALVSYCLLLLLVLANNFNSKWILCVQHLFRSYWICQTDNFVLLLVLFDLTCAHRPWRRLFFSCHFISDSHPCSLNQVRTHFMYKLVISRDFLFLSFGRIIKSTLCWCFRKQLTLRLVL